MWFDSHFHLNGLAKGWQSDSIDGGLAVSIDIDDWQVTQQRLLALSGDWRQAIGFHPWIVRESLPWSELESWLIDYECLSVGEVGLDGSPARRSNAQLQWNAFERQVSLARQYRRVMSLHLVHDNEHGYHLLKQHKDSRVIVHGFTGSLQQALRWQELGFYIGVGERLLYRITDKRQQLLQGLDWSFILLETDSPYSMTQHDVSTPDTIPILAQILALSWDVSISDVEMICQKNWLTLWGDK
jgi:TatD DNase family protein